MRIPSTTEVLATALLRLFKLLGLVKRAAMNVPAIRRAQYRQANKQVFSQMVHHDTMLADHVRVDTYARAIARHVNPGDVVLDLGTGTGVLAFLAAKHNPRVVHAIDHSPVIFRAQAVAQANGIERVQFHHVHSSNFVAPEPVDVIVHEQMGAALFDERMVENLLDLRGRVLKPDGTILPSRFEFFIDPVELKESIPFAWQQRDIHGVDFSALRKAGELYDQALRFVRPCEIAQSLCDRSPLLAIDLNVAHSSVLPQALNFSRPVIRTGRLDGFYVSFIAHFDEETYLDTCPLQNHDPPNAWPHLLLRVPCRDLAAGDQLSFSLHAGDLAERNTWRWRCHAQTP